MRDEISGDAMTATHGAASEPAHAFNTWLRPRIALRTQACIRLVDPVALRAIVVEGNNCVVSLSGERLLVRETLASLESRLPPGTLVRIQRGVLVNLTHVTEVRRTRNGDYEFVTDDGALLRSGPTYREAIRDLLRAL